MAASKSKKGVRSENVNELFKNISKQKTKITKAIDNDVNNIPDNEDISTESPEENESTILTEYEQPKEPSKYPIIDNNNEDDPDSIKTSTNEVEITTTGLNAASQKDEVSIYNEEKVEIRKTPVTNDHLSNDGKNPENEKTEEKVDISALNNETAEKKSKYIEVITSKAGRPKKFANGTFSISIRLPAELEPIFDIAIQRFQGNKTAYLTQLVVKDLMENQDNYKMMDEAVKQLETLRNSMFGNDKNLMTSINKAAIDWSGLKI